MQFDFSDGALSITEADGSKCLFPYHPAELRNWYDEAEAVAFVANIPLYFMAKESAEDKAEKAVAAKKGEIRADFTAAIAPPVEALGIVWNSGFDSSLSIDGAARIAQAAGLSEVGIHSLDNRRHVLSIAEATQVAVAIGGSYQQHLGVKQARMVALHEIDLDADDSLSQIDSI